MADANIGAVPHSAETGAKTYFHASDHQFKPGDRVLPGWHEDVNKPGLSGGPARDSHYVWMQDDVHEIYTYGDHLYEVRPEGQLIEWNPHIYTADSAVVVREVAATDRSEYVELANRLRRDSKVAASSRQPA